MGRKGKKIMQKEEGRKGGNKKIMEGRGERRGKSREDKRRRKEK